MLVGLSLLEGMQDGWLLSVYSHKLTKVRRHSIYDVDLPLNSHADYQAVTVLDPSNREAKAQLRKDNLVSNFSIFSL